MLTLYHGNRLEDLRAQLFELLQQPLADVLAPEWVVVQNQGMETWLCHGLAEQSGLAANLEFPLPATFIWRMMATQLGDIPDDNHFNREILLWACYELLPELLQRPGFEQPRSYLSAEAGGHDLARKRYQLAKRVADLFDQYLVYRYDWIERWERGEDEHWQAQLWRALSERLGGRHRTRLLLEFLQQAELSAEGLPERISLFGVTALAPAYLQVVARLAEVTDIHLFASNPSLAYWGDIEPERHMARLRDRWSRSGKPDVSAYYEVGNPLLASMGKVGRDFHDLLQQLQCQQQELFAESAQLSLLTALQVDILNLLDRRQNPDGIDPKDGSVQLHACHGPMREVQVLHDQLLALFERLPGLRPRDIVVMAPDIGLYAPYIDGVFGAITDDRRIPWTVADLGASHNEPLVQAFMALAGLPSSRLTVSEVLGLLEVPALARRFGLDEKSLERIRDWVVDSGIRWGADGAERAELGFSSEEHHSWQFGLSRLMLGFALPEGDALFAGLAPQQGVSGSETPWLGGLWELIEQLRHWRKRLAEPASGKEWQTRYNTLLECFFKPSEKERYLTQEISATLSRFAGQVDTAGYEGPLDPQVVREHLLEILEGIGGSRRFLAGQVTFCNMVPMRSIPFRVVALLGMNDLDYPRNRQPATFDLMGQAPRKGDRSLREDDRYLFLEALLSAREVFYVSYQGRNRRNNEPRQPSVLVSELLDAIDRGFGADDGRCHKALVTGHPLQPFSPRNFMDADASYAKEWLDALQPGDDALQGPFFHQPLPASGGTTIALNDLLLFCRQPTRYFLQQRLGLYPEEQETALEDQEPFSLNRLEEYHIRADSLKHHLQDRDYDQRQALSLQQGRGGLPEGVFGELTFEALWQESEGLWQRIDALELHDCEPLEVDLTLAGFRLVGRMGPLYDRGVVIYRPAKLKADNRMELWLRHLVLNLLQPQGIERESRCLTLDADLQFGPLEGAEALLIPWLHALQAGTDAPFPLLPRSSLAYATALAAGKPEEVALSRAMEAWLGNDRVPGEGSDNYHKIAYRNRNPFDQAFMEAAETLLLPLLEQEVKP